MHHRSRLPLPTLRQVRSAVAARTPRHSAHRGGIVTAALSCTLLAASLAVPASTLAQAGGLAALPPVPAPAEEGYVEANGISYHYQIHGEGDPLLLLHGGLGSFGMFGPVLPALMEHRKVIGVDLHGHGRTELGEREISLIDIADDLAVVLGELGYDRVDVVGYSFGGGAAFRLAVQHPERVRRLVVVSAGFAQDGYYPEILAQQAQMGASAAPFMMETPMYEAYTALAPEPERFPELLQRMGDFMRKPYDWTEDAKALSVQTLLVFGDSDMYRPEHIVEFYQLLGGGLRDAGWMREHISPNRLAILPDLTHYEIFASPVLVSTIRQFLDG